MAVKTTVITIVVLVFGILVASLFLNSKQFIELIQPLSTVFGRFTLANVAPTVELIFINDSSVRTFKTCTFANPLDCFVRGYANSSVNFLVKVKIIDTNGNCNTFNFNNVTAYLCNGTVSCSVANADHTISMSFAAGEQWGTGGIYCNFTGSLPVWFYETNGTWRVNVTATDGINRSSNVSSWTYDEIWSFAYPDSGGQWIDMGSLSVGQWNNGTGGQLMKNTGNIVLDLLWNATNFTGSTYGDRVGKNGNNYRIDDDVLSPSDTNNIIEQNIPFSDATKIYFDPDSGLRRCTTPACFNLNASFNVYWHLQLDPGLLADTYNNTIEIGGVGHQ